MKQLALILAVGFLCAQHEGSRRGRYEEAEPPDLAAPVSPSAALAATTEKDRCVNLVLTLASFTIC